VTDGVITKQKVFSHGMITQELSAFHLSRDNQRARVDYWEYLLKVSVNLQPTFAIEGSFLSLSPLIDLSLHATHECYSCQRASIINVNRALNNRPKISDYHRLQVI